MSNTRRGLEAHLFARSVRVRRAAPHGDPSLFEVVAGVSVFLAAAAGCLYLVAWLGR